MTISSDPHERSKRDSGPPGSGDASKAPAAEPRPFPAEEARARLVRFHDWFIGTELLNGAPFLPDAERAAFLHYYREFPQRGNAAAVAKYLRALWRLDAGWVVRWIAAQPTRPRILDAGCGFGTFTMMFAAVGADVVGVDLRPDRLDAAERRLAFYEQTTGRRLSARYERADVTKPSGDRFDMVWVYNALSHIEPVEPFIDQMRAQIRPGGLLVVGDINGGHPVHAQHLAQVRSQVVQEYVAPDGTRHAYAMERVFTPSALHQLMKSRGFAVRRHELFYGGVGRLPDALYAVLTPMQRYLGWNGRFALRQLMVATPR
jgi:2-polyprenyl-3-methyl-5-hydroxy-6-metoxy-1,4-benzoquinol methylase